MKIYLLLISVLTLSACETFSGLSQDVKDFGQTVSSKAKELTSSQSTAEQATSTAMANSMALENPICPPVIIDPQLSRLTEFYDEQKTSASQKVSSVHLARASSICTNDAEYLTLQIDLAFDGKLGPKARRKSGDQTFFAYPYFIAVKDNDGNEIVKELFAASMTYGSKQNSQSIVETVRQKLPYNNDGTLPSYQIHVGLQLTQSQLFYNASL